MEGWAVVSCNSLFIVVAFFLKLSQIPPTVVKATIVSMTNITQSIIKMKKSTLPTKVNYVYKRFILEDLSLPKMGVTFSISTFIQVILLH